MVLTHNPTPFLFAWPAPMDQTPSCRLVTTAGCVMPRKTISSRLRSENGSPPFFRQSNLSWGCKVGTRPWILICPMGWFFSTQKRGRQHHTGKPYDGRCISIPTLPNRTKTQGGKHRCQCVRAHAKTARGPRHSNMFGSRHSPLLALLGGGLQTVQSHGCIVSHEKAMTQKAVGSGADATICWQDFFHSTQIKIRTTPFPPGYHAPPLPVCTADGGTWFRISQHRHAVPCTPAHRKVKRPMFPKQTWIKTEMSFTEDQG